jgi:hypothetical protein
MSAPSVRSAPFALLLSCSTRTIRTTRAAARQRQPRQFQQFQQ